MGATLRRDGNYIEEEEAICFSKAIQVRGHSCEGDTELRAQRGLWYQPEMPGRNQDVALL